MIEPHHEKTRLWDFRTCMTQTGLYNHRRWLEAWNPRFRKQRNYTIYVEEKKKVLISCAFVFADATQLTKDDKYFQLFDGLETICNMFTNM